MRLKDDQKTDQIFAGALALTARVGLAGLTVPLIAREAGVATGTIYIYFKNKEELIRELFKDTKQRFSRGVFTGYKVDGPVKECLRKIWENMLRYSAEHYPAQVFMQQYNVSPYGRETQAMALSAMQPLLDVIAEGQRQDLVKGGNPGFILALLAGFVGQLAGVLHEQPGLLTKEYVETTFGFVWDAMKK